MMIDEGDLVKVDLDPVRGSEQGGYRPCLVLTDRAFHETRSTAIVCPITTNLAPWPTKLPLPDGLAVVGAVLCEQVRIISRLDRGMERVGCAPPETLAAVRRMIGQLLHIDEAFDAAAPSR